MPKPKDFQVTNETISEGRLYLENGTISMLKPNWYIVNNGVFNDKQMHQFVALLQISTKVVEYPFYDDLVKVFVCILGHL